MRSIWKGAITFGLVNVPVKLYSATEDHDISLHQVHDKDGGRIRYQRKCEACGKVVNYENIDKAYDDGERTVVLTAEDFEALPVERSREIDVVEFVPSDQIDPIMFDRSYFLEPDSKSNKAYALLRRTLEQTDRTAIVNFSLRQKTRLGALRVRGDVLMLQSLLWDDEVREARFPSLDEPVKLSAKELEMSAALVESFASDFEPSEFTDEYQVELKQLIEAKLEKGDALDTEETFGERPEREGGEVLDLMEALRRSVDKNRVDKNRAGRSGAGKSRPGAGSADEEHADEPKPTRKRAPATKKPAERKTAERKPAAATAAEKKPARKSKSA